MNNYRKLHEENIVLGRITHKSNVAVAMTVATALVSLVSASLVLQSGSSSAVADGTHKSKNRLFCLT